jgi:dTDP-4-amino-4,6-dideoxygalactose transaminase
VTGGSAAARPAHAGGTPVRSDFLPFFRPCVGREEEDAVVAVLRSGWLTTGPRTAAFEEAFARSLGVRRAVGVSSCTAGLHLLLRAFDIGAGDEVVTSPVTFPATANAILASGATPVFADVVPGWLTLDPRAVKAALTPRTRAIVAVHLAGWPCEMDALAALAAESGLAVIEDAAHALGARYHGRPAGALADAASFSFYATKNLTTGEGGMVTTDREEIVPRLRLERLHGIDLDASQREGRAYRHWEAVAMGYKYNLTDFEAALGLVQLERLPGLLAERRRLDARYRNLLADLPAFEPLTGPDAAETAAHLFPILIRPGALRIDRDELLAALLAENVGVGVHFRALPLHRHFRATVPTPADAVRVAVSSSERLLSIPIFGGMSDRDQDDVVEALARIALHYAA